MGVGALGHKKCSGICLNQESNIGDIDFKKLRARAMRFACSCGYGGLAEDFAQEYCFAFWRGEHRSLVYQLANFLRAEYGRIDCNPARNRVNFGTVRLDENKMGKNEDPCDAIFLKEILALTKPSKRYFLQLWLNGYSLVEISKRFGYTRHRASQILSEIVRDVKKQLR